MSVVYLLHFLAPIAPGKHSCQHYLGYTTQPLKQRLTEHRTGTGAQLTQVAYERGIAFRCVRVWKNGTRTLERQLKNRKAGPRLCPVCQGQPVTYEE